MMHKTFAWIGIMAVDLILNLVGQMGMCWEDYGYCSLLG
jgi:hypothetical protein